jgi:hypothetical protein
VKGFLVLAEFRDEYRVPAPGALRVRALRPGVCARARRIYPYKYTKINFFALGAET